MNTAHNAPHAKFLLLAITVVASFLFSTPTYAACVLREECSPPNSWAPNHSVCQRDGTGTCSPPNASFSAEEQAAAGGLKAATGFVTNFFAPKTGFNVGVARPEIVAGKIIQGALGLIGVIFGILVIY